MQNLISSSDNDLDFDSIVYRPPAFNRITLHTKSRVFYGLDTEAMQCGRCFLVCTSEGDIWKGNEWIFKIFTRKYRSTSFVCWNLHYDMSALLQILPRQSLSLLQTSGVCIFQDFQISIIGDKCLTIRRKSHSVHLYDIASFYGCSLEAAASMHLQEHKHGIDPQKFTAAYIRNNRTLISDYCIQDAKLTYKLTQILIKHFESFGVYPQKLYSTAAISWAYFRTHCPYIHIKKEWRTNKELLRYACLAYNGGKFEVTRKGPGHYTEYDIVSAYPYEISKLVDTRKARAIFEPRYRKNAIYSFLHCKIKIPVDLPNPVAIKNHGVCRFPCGEIIKVITKAEYEYFANNGADITILTAWHLVVDNKQYPYKSEIEKLMEAKNQYKREGDLLRYHTIKIFLNSLYGKMCQLIPVENIIKAGSAWHPIYAAEITANCRVRVTDKQRCHPEIIAVHTDSIICNRPIDILQGSSLGSWELSQSGDGLILGSGVYQIGDKTRFRGFRTKTPLIELIPQSGRLLHQTTKQPLSWRQVAHRNLNPHRINRFEDTPKNLALRFDTKRIWLDDYQSYAQVMNKNIDSLPLVWGMRRGCLQ